MLTAPIAKTASIRMGGLIVLAVCAIALLATSSAQAHSLFIQSSRYLVNMGKASPLFFCYGHHFPVDDGVRRKKLKNVQVRKPDGTTQDIVLRNETCLHSYMVKYDQPGTYALNAETNPGFYTKWVDKKGRARSSIKPMSSIIDKASKVETSLYSKQYAKTYVVCQKPSHPFPANLGLGLELVPSRDITQLKEGETVRLRVFRGGKPYQEEGYWDATYNGFSTMAEDMFIPRQKAAAGWFDLPIKVTGRWYVRYFVKTQAGPAEKDQYLQLKETATLVFQVPNQRKSPKVDSH